MMTRLFLTFGVRLISVDMVRLGSKMFQPYTFYLSTTMGVSLSQMTHNIQIRDFITCHRQFSEDKSLATLDTFQHADNKNKDSFLDLLHFYKNKDIRRRGHVEFIYAALKYMKEFGVERDLEVYKALMDVMPKGKFVAENLIQAEFQHYPKQQQCIIDLLEQMEINRVCPDEEMEDMLLNIFGRRSHAIRRFWRMMYWMPKMRYLSPWPVPDPPPDDSLELAKIAIKRITSVDPTTQITVFQTKDVKDSIDDTWIVSGQSLSQKELIERHKTTENIYVEGSFRVWLRGKSVNHFILRADPDLTPKPKIDPDDISNLKIPLFNTPLEAQVTRKEIVHEQEDGTILAVCATGSSSRDSLLSWIRLLQKDNPKLGKIPVLFTLKSPIGSTEPLEEIEGDDPVPMVVKDLENQ